MKTYIAFLRGINVSGQKKIKMAELREHLEALPLNEVQTYIQSGNIVFKAKEQGHTELEQQISGKIQEQYGFEVPVRVRTFTELKQIHANNAFPEVASAEFNKLFVAFLDRVPTAENTAKLNELEFPNEAYSLVGKELYFYCRNGAGKAKLSNTLIERKLQVSATSRNWKTIEKLLALAEN